MTEAATVRRGPSRWTLLALILGTALALDQWTKYLAVERLTYLFQRFGIQGTFEKWRAFYRIRHIEGLAREPFVVLKPVWRMSYAENAGAAFGMFRTMPEGLRNGFFLLVSLGAVAFILWYLRKVRDDQRWLQVALSFTLAGALGNFVDRMARGYVVDFVQWHWWNRPDLYWPTFNVADSMIVVGVVLLVLLPGEAAAGDRRG
jgi:signal peptidase II